MHIILNGRGYVTKSTNLAELLEEAGYDGLVVATALDQQFIAKDQRTGTALQEGSQVEVVAPMQGG